MGVRPAEFLGDQIELLEDEAAAAKHYGIDGDLRLQICADNDNLIETGEKVYLFFGMRRGGDVYYALDVTQPGAPPCCGGTTARTLPGLGQIWSTPVPTRINVTRRRRRTPRSSCS